MSKIVLDVFGCDKGADEILLGAIDALNENPNLQLLLSGNKDIMNPILDNLKADRNRIEILDAKEIITNDESPVNAMKTKKDSSLVRGIEALKEREDLIGFVSAGSTGAVLASATLLLGRIKGVLRPALAPILPTVNLGNVCLIDCGANVDSKPEYLAQFALMGISYMRSYYSVIDPSVALVSVGVEDKKGNELTKEVFKRLKEMPINFKGNMEARDSLSGDYDVLVCDGFVGNVLLKTLEGTVKIILSRLKANIKASSSAKFGYLFMKKAFKNLKKELDYNSRGGAPLLGVEKVVIKSHGSSDSSAIKASILQAYQLASSDFIKNLKEEINASLNS